MNLTEAVMIMAVVFHLSKHGFENLFASKNRVLDFFSKKWAICVHYRVQKAFQASAIKNLQIHNS